MPKVETELFKDKIEVSLDGRQIFYLFFGGAVVASLVFVLGVMVGKRVEARTSLPDAHRVAEDPLAALDMLSMEPEEELAFAATLRKGGPGNYGVQFEKLLKNAMTKGKRDEHVSPSARKAQSIGKQDRDKSRLSSEPRAKKPTRSAKFTLQLSSFRTKQEAQQLVERLIGAGYKPYVVETNVESKGRWFRVRLGSYDSYDKAITAKLRFEQRQKIIAYVTRLPR